MRFSDPQPGFGLLPSRGKARNGLLVCSRGRACALQPLPLWFPFLTHNVPGPGMKRAMLEVVATGVVTEPSDVQQYIRCTLLAHMNSSKASCRAGHPASSIPSVGFLDGAVHLVTGRHQERAQLPPVPPRRSLLRQPWLPCSGWEGRTMHS